VVARVRRESWRSLRVWAGESLGRFDCAVGLVLVSGGLDDGGGRGLTAIVGPGAPGEYLEEGEVWGVVFWC